MGLPLTGIGELLDFFILIFFYFNLKKHSIIGNKFFPYFEKFTLSMSMFFLLPALAIFIFSKDTGIIGSVYIWAHIFLYISFGYLARVSLLMLKPSFDSLNIFRLYLLFAAAITAVNVALFKLPVIPDSGIIQWNTAPLVGVLSIIIGWGSLLLSGILFTRESFKRPQLLGQYALIDLSFLLVIIGLPLHDIAMTPVLYMAADVATTVGFVIMLLGVITSSEIWGKKYE